MNYTYRLCVLLSCSIGMICFNHPVFAIPKAHTVSNPPKHHPSPPPPSEDDSDKKSEVDVNPTQALFSAINTGNLMAAKDALNRGADLQGRNILGQTPLDMSIDLNRDQITFLLLSTRGYNNSPQSLVTTTTSTEQGKLTIKNGSGHFTVKGKSKNEKRYVTSQPKPYYGSDGGIANPEIGFLGFQHH